MSPALQPFFPEGRDPSLPRTIEVTRYRDGSPFSLEMARTWCQETAPDAVMDMVVHSRQFLHGPEFFELMGEQWSTATTLWRSVSVLRNSLERESMHSLSMAMTREERKFHDELPDEFRVYRGCHHRNVRGIAWTLDRGIAVQFPHSPRFRQEAPAILVEAVVRREQCLVKLERNMLEVVAWEPKVVGVELLAPTTH